MLARAHHQIDLGGVRRTGAAAEPDHAALGVGWPRFRVRAASHDVPRCRVASTNREQIRGRASAPATRGPLESAAVQVAHTEVAATTDEQTCGTKTRSDAGTAAVGAVTIPVLVREVLRTLAGALPFELGAKAFFSFRAQRRSVKIV